MINLNSVQNQAIYQQQPQQQIKTFIFGDLPNDEKQKFLEFMINNNVEFSRDPNDGLYIANIKIVNKQPQAQQKIISESSKTQKSLVQVNIKEQNGLNDNIEKMFNNKIQNGRNGHHIPNSNSISATNNGSNSARGTQNSMANKIGTAAIQSKTIRDVSIGKTNKVNVQKQMGQAIKSKMVTHSQPQVLQGHQQDLNKFDSKIKQLEEQAQSKNKQLNSARGGQPISRNSDLNAITSQKSNQSKQSISTVQHVKQTSQVNNQNNINNILEENYSPKDIIQTNNNISPNNNILQQYPNSKQSSSNDLLNFSQEYQSFLNLVNLQNPQQYRQKKMSISNLLRMIEEIYAFRYQKDTTKLQSSQSNFNPADKAFYVTVFDFMNQKFKQKKMLDQATIDFIVSIDYFRYQSTEIQTFYNFFIQNLEIKDLMFYLYMRSLAEKEINQVITRMNTGDIRLLKIPNAKCLKLIKNFFQNIGSNDNLEDTQEIEEISQLFLESIIEDASIHDKYDELEQKVQFSFFLESILKEFQDQQQKNNDNSEIVVSGQDQFSLIQDQMNQQQLDIRIDDNQQFSQNLGGLKGYKQSTGNQNFDNFNQKLRSQDHKLDLDDNNLTGGLKQSLDVISQEQKYIIKDKILKYVIGNKLNQVISFMLSHYAEELSKEVLDIIKEEIRTVLSNKIKLLLDAVFIQSEFQWIKLLSIAQFTEENRRQFQSLIFKSQETVSNIIQDNKNHQSNVNIQMRIEDLEDIAKMILHVNELKVELAKLVGSLTMQARVGIETESDNPTDHISFNNGAGMNGLDENNVGLGGYYKSGESDFGLNSDSNEKKIIQNYMRQRY